jgi:hypothetical protein
MNPMFNHLRKRGVMVMFYNINNIESYKAALRYSIDGMQTDRPKGLFMMIDSDQDELESSSHSYVFSDL